VEATLGRLPALRYLELADCRLPASLSALNRLQLLR
jgi:hypothetical protein